jgi:hypothetical protein
VNDHGFHWTPCRGRGGGSAGLVVLVVIVVIVAADAGPVVSAAAELAEVVAFTVAGLLAAGVVVAAVVWRARRRRARVARAVRPLAVAVVREPAVLDGRQVPAALDPPRSRVSAYPRFDAQPHVVTGGDSSCPYASCYHNAPDALPAWRRSHEEVNDG